jgi:hypothetical protein
MILKPLPADPDPTEEDLADLKNKLQQQGYNIKRLDRRYLTLKWRLHVVNIDPSALHVPFPPRELDYKVYLASSVWQQIRQTVLSSANGRCAGCGADATQVHHRDYRPRVLSGEDITSLVALCADCHEFVHEWIDGKPKDWNDEDGDLMALVADYDALQNKSSS